MNIYFCTWLPIWGTELYSILLKLTIEMRIIHVKMELKCLWMLHNFHARKNEKTEVKNHYIRLKIELMEMNVMFSSKSSTQMRNHPNLFKLHRNGFPWQSEKLYQDKKSKRDVNNVSNKQWIISNFDSKAIVK